MTQPTRVIHLDPRGHDGAGARSSAHRAQRGQRRGFGCTVVQHRDRFGRFGQRAFRAAKQTAARVGQAKGFAVAFDLAQAETVLECARMARQSGLVLLPGRPRQAVSCQ